MNFAPDFVTPYTHDVEQNVTVVNVQLFWGEKGESNRNSWESREDEANYLLVIEIQLSEIENFVGVSNFGAHRLQLEI